MTYKNIEQVAKLFLKRKINFNYAGQSLIIKDSFVSSETFYSASYHAQTGDVVLMDVNYNEVKHDKVKEFFDKF